jgi:hypothetical protein
MYSAPLKRPMLCRMMCVPSRPLTVHTKKAGERFWEWTTQHRPTWRESKVEAAVVFCVFGVTGSTSVALTRPALKSTFGLEGSMADGPWSYRIISVLAVSPIYACCLLAFGTAAGRHTFFAAMATKIFGRFLPSSLSKRLACPPAMTKKSK